ncbi:MAG: biotin/lipoyl-binding protein [Saprospiraceae bacterium]|nr:biotin/lipoyl-binding protein [Saprospiraceae bacterium]
MQNNIINTITLCLLATLITACQRAQTTENTMESEVDSRVELTLDAIRSHPDIEIGTLQTRSIQTQVACTGMLDIPPTDRISVHSKVEGFLTDLRFIDGDFVKQGTVLARIENISFVQKQKQLLELKAQLELAKNNCNAKNCLTHKQQPAKKALTKHKVNWHC